MDRVKKGYFKGGGRRKGERKVARGGIEVVGGGHKMNEMNRGRRGYIAREKSSRATDNERRYKLKVKRSDRRGLDEKKIPEQE